MVIYDCDVSFIIAELKCVVNSHLERKGVGILAQRVVDFLTLAQRVGFLTPHEDKIWVFGCSYR